MPVRQQLRVDLVAVAVLVAGLLVAACVFSFDPADRPGATVYPAHSTPNNVLGVPGAWLAFHFLTVLGVSVYGMLICWLVLALLLLLRKRFWKWFRRLTGWLILIPSSAVIADLAIAHFDLSPLNNAGGTLGVWLRRELESRLTAIGQITVIGSSTAIALLLAADFIYRPFFSCLRTFFGSVFSAKCHQPTLVRPQSTTTATTNPPPVSASAGKHAPENSIPIRRPNQTTPPQTESAPVPIVRPAAAPSDEERFADFELPPLTLLEEPQPFPYEEHDHRLREKAALLEKTFKDFSLNVRVVGINTGPVVTQFEVALETGLRVNKVTCLSDDLALNMKVPSVRIVAPIPGKNTVGVEIPNEHRATVRLKEVICTFGPKTAKSKIPLFLGKDTEGRPLVHDLAEMPHLLIAGRTGTGKSVCMNAIILSILMTRRPDEVKMVMIDPKMLELSEYGKIPHLMHPVVKDMKKAEAILSWAVDKMEERYDFLSRARVRNIAAYNELSPEEIRRRLSIGEGEALDEPIPERMPYIVIFVDEMNDLMMTMKKEVEGHIIRLAQKSRAAGIHLVVATQKPTVDVITGLIKSNLPTRICFQVSSRSDSRVVLDEMGADKLLGKGDMLFLAPGTSTLMRAQGTYASDLEITKVVEFLECEPCYAEELMQLQIGDHKDGSGTKEHLRSRDELYEQAIEVIVREGRGSVSLLQRALGIGYGRAARLIDFMAEDGIVGNYNGSQAREVLYSPERWDELKGVRSEEPG